MAAGFSKAGVAALGVFADVASRAVGRYLCENIDSIGSFLLGQGNELATLSAASYKYLFCDPAEPPPGGLAPNVPFVGGQCLNVPYYLISTYTIEGQPRITSPGQGGAETADGPIHSVTYYVGTGNVWRRVLRRGIPAVETDVSIGVPYPLYQNWVFSHPQIYDGYVDNCGNPGGPVNPALVFPGPAPLPGQTIAPRKEFTETVDRTNGPSFPIVLPVGPLVVAPSGKLQLDVGGQRFNLNPELELDLEDGEAATQESIDSLREAVDSLQEAVEALQEAAEPPIIAGEAVVRDCNGNEIVSGYSGQGLTGLSAQLSSVLEALGGQAVTFCPAPDEPPVLEEIFLGTVTSDPVQRFYDLEIPNGTLFVDITATTTAKVLGYPGSVGADQDERQSRFGTAALLVEVAGRYRAVKHYVQVYSNSRILVPEEFRYLAPLAIRVSLLPGSQATLSAFYSLEG